MGRKRSGSAVGDLLVAVLTLGAWVISEHGVTLLILGALAVGAWVAYWLQTNRSASIEPASVRDPHDSLDPIHLIHDRDPLFTRAFEATLEHSGVHGIRLPSRSPNLNAYAERFVQTIKSECLAQVIPIGEAHLRRAVREYVDHYHSERNHQGIGNRLISGTVDQGRARGPVQCRERLGGLLRYYSRVAA